MTAMYDLLKETSFYEEFIQHYNLDSTLIWIIILILLMYYIFTFLNSITKLFANEKKANSLTNIFIIITLVALLNIATILFLYVFIIDFLKLFNDGLILLSIGIFIIIFVIHLLLNFVIYAVNDTLINSNLKTVKERNKKIFKMKHKETNNYYDIRSIMYNHKNSHAKRLENKYIRNYYKKYFHLKKQLMNNLKLKFLPITNFYIWSVLSQVVYISFINGIIILQINDVIQQENYNILVLLVLLIIIQIIFVKLTKLVD